VPVKCADFLAKRVKSLLRLDMGLARAESGAERGTPGEQGAWWWVATTDEPETDWPNGQLRGHDPGARLSTRPIVLEGHAMARWTSSKHAIWIAALLTWLALAPSAFAADGDKSTVKGLITAIDGDTVTVRDSNNVDHKIMLTSTTEIKKKEGLAAVRFERMQKTALMPGLPIVADLVAQGDHCRRPPFPSVRTTCAPRSKSRQASRRHRRRSMRWASAWTTSVNTKRSPRPK
jgi:hypothetical protein